jgi:hypothetical protein
MLLGLMVLSATHTPADERPAPDVSVISIDWKYSGYDRSETVKEKGSKNTTESSIGYRIARRPLYVFKYTAKATLRNAGLKTIKSLSWDYVFVDGKDQKELKRHKLQSKVQILPGETQTLAKEVGLDPKESTVYINTGKQQVEIVRIEYTDGSVWRR